MNKIYFFNTLCEVNITLYLIFNAAAKHGQRHCTGSRPFFGYTKSIIN